MARAILGGRVRGEIGYDNLPVSDRSLVVAALQKGASRRQVMSWLVGAGVTIAAAGRIVTSASEALAATPKRGGHIRFAWDQHGPADTLDPVLFTAAIDYIRGRMTYNSLTRLQPDLSVRPEIAESFEPNADASEWTFKLRRGVEWHDGSKLTADDVIYSMRRHIGSDSKSKAHVLVSAIKEWVKDDDYTVRAIMDAPNAELPIVLGTFHFKIVKEGTTDFSLPVGTGPYLLKEFTPGVRSVHVRNDNYWNSGAGPYIDEFEVFAITDSVARVNALIAGDIQMMGNLDPGAIGRIEAADGVEVLTVESGSYNEIVAKLDSEPGNNPDFVKGLKLLQRRDRILNVIQKGNGSIGNDQPIGPAYGASWCKEVPTGEYDPDKAKFHLNKSGITRAVLDVAEVAAGVTDTCLLLQSECTKIGFDLQINKRPTDGYWGTVWLKQPLYGSAWNMRPTANIMMSLAYKSDAPWNTSAWKNERFDSLLMQARSELDPDKRYEMNCEMQMLASEGSGCLIAAYRAFIDATSSKVKGIPPIPLSGMAGMEWPEFVWLDT